MASMRHQGQLTVWKDDRDFGFIKPSGGGKDVFLHISAVQGASRRPLVGDTVLYEVVVEPDGRWRAANAVIRGVTLAAPPSPSLPNRHQSAPQPSRSARPSGSSHQTRRRRAQSLDRLAVVLSGGCIVAIIGAIALATGQSEPGPSETMSAPIPISDSLNPSCLVKGNVSVETNNRLYHVPGMEDYEITEIDPLRGERWFCTEAEAISSGWRRAPR